MTILPGLDTIRELSSVSGYNVAPVSCEILSDFTTPIEIMRVLKNISVDCYMLESALKNETIGRYTFLGFEPKLKISCTDGQMQIGDLSFKVEQPSIHLRRILCDYKSPVFDYLPPFTGGLVGYFAYDYVGYAQTEARVKTANEEELKDLELMLFDRVIAFDHLHQKIIFIINIRLDDALEERYEAAKTELKQLVDLICHGHRTEECRGRLAGEITQLFNQEQFCQMVKKAKQYIFEGDIFQIVLSNRLSAPFDGSLFNTYRVLRSINPSPYMFYFRSEDIEIAGASPETLVSLDNGILHTYPLAGTRPRGKNHIEDQKNAEDLLQDDKELAEHNMLVDLGRNDLGRISEFGTVEIEKLRVIERFSHVMHIGSSIKGKLCHDKDAIDAIEAVLPAGTLSGAPKIRACQIIGELEKNKRGLYGGAIGYIDFSGNMHTCIAIRLLYKKNGQVFIRSGAGIVADSDPQKEFEECHNKALSCLKALQLSQEGL
ncbi:Anthranilate synthase component 1 [Anaerobiospirillum thomasii]|uniref:anthranilate synthase component I family protein n=1 Tax=Anaerobiospirillum thomasii TaxID=179995 RepID=UPI000D81F016|nr:anthranilate synthase component I family protein [Anaerobiospirillum thomasii]SPT67839.1 Anthranilate synthase component 1 [Anaerobiospirillum thomasii]